jgi:mediator of RNA polymerase II transcription subunit 12
MPYSLEWSNVVTTYLKKQLDLLSSQKIQARQTQHRRDDAESQFFNGQWKYAVQLTSWQYAEGLLDQRHFLKWSLDQFSASNFDQTNLMISIVLKFMTDYSRSRALSRIFIEACIRKIERV